MVLSPPFKAKTFAWGFSVIGNSLILLICWYVGNSRSNPLWLLLLLAAYVARLYVGVEHKQRAERLRAAALHERDIAYSKPVKSGITKSSVSVRDLPAWVQFPDTERVEWFNKMILQCWPYIGQYANKLLNDRILPEISKLVPRFIMDRFKVTVFDLGEIPPRVTGIKVYTENVGRDRVLLDVDFVYAGDCRFVLNLGPLVAGLQNLNARGKLRLLLKPLLPNPPLAGGLGAYFLELPHFDYTLSGAAQLGELPGVSSIIHSIINSQITNLLVLPNGVEFSLVDGVDPDELLWLPHQGVLRVHVVEARELAAEDIGLFQRGKSDPYAIVQLGAESFRTETIHSNLNPKWEQRWEAVVENIEKQQLNVEVFDWDRVGNDDLLGRAMLDLKPFAVMGVQDRWFDLQYAKSGKIHLKLEWCQLVSDASLLKELMNNRDCSDTYSIAVVFVFVDSARDLPSHRSEKDPSPYLEFTVGQQIKRTKFQRRTANPIFQQNFHFFLQDPETQVIQVRAHHMPHNRLHQSRFLGEGEIPLRPLLDEPNMDLKQARFPLNLGVKGGSFTVNLRLRLIQAGALLDAESLLPKPAMALSPSFHKIEE